MKSIRYDIRELKEKLKLYEKTPSYLSKIQDISEGIEKKISEFK